MNLTFLLIPYQVRLLLALASFKCHFYLPTYLVNNSNSRKVGYCVLQKLKIKVILYLVPENGRMDDGARWNSQNLKWNTNGIIALSLVSTGFCVIYPEDRNLDRTAGLENLFIPVKHLQNHRRTSSFMYKTFKNHNTNRNHNQFIVVATQYSGMPLLTKITGCRTRPSACDNKIQGKATTGWPSISQQMSCFGYR